MSSKSNILEDMRDVMRDDTIRSTRNKRIAG